MERKYFHIGDIILDEETPWIGPMQVIEVNYLNKFYRLRGIKNRKKIYIRKFSNKYLKLEKRNDR